MFKVHIFDVAHNLKKTIFDNSEWVQKLFLQTWEPVRNITRGVEIAFRTTPHVYSWLKIPKVSWRHFAHSFMSEQHSDLRVCLLLPLFSRIREHKSRIPFHSSSRAWPTGSIQTLQRNKIDWFWRWLVHPCSSSRWIFSWQDHKMIIMIRTAPQLHCSDQIGSQQPCGGGEGS